MGAIFVALIPILIQSCGRREDCRGAAELALVAGDLALSLTDPYDSEKVDTATVVVATRAMSGVASLSRRAEILEQEVDSTLFAARFAQTVELISVRPDRPVLSCIDREAQVVLEFDTSRLIPTADLAMQPQLYVGRQFGRVLVRLHFFDRDRERVEDVEIPMRFR